MGPRTLDPKTKASLIQAVLAGESLQGECEIFSFEGNDGKKRYQAVALSKWVPNVACVFSLPTDTRNVYVTLTDADRQMIRRVLSTLEETEAESSVVLGNVLLLNSPELRERDIVGALLLPTSTSNALRHLPLDIAIAEAEYQTAELSDLRAPLCPSSVDV